MSKRIFVTGTGTDIGKTYVTGLMLKKLKESGRKTAYYKAAMSGNDRRADGTLIPGDALAVKTMAGLSQPLEEMCPYVYEHAYSPHLASKIEGNPVQMDVVKEGFEQAVSRYDAVTMEGAGGILCPLRADEIRLQTEDVVKELGLACLIVADAGLGTINGVVLTVFYMRSKGIPVKGVIFNHFHKGNELEEDNLVMCEAMTGVPVIACVADDAEEFPLSADELLSYYEDEPVSKGEIR